MAALMADSHAAPRPLPLLFVSPSLQGGGAEKHLVRLLKHLDRRQVAPHLALHRGDGVFALELPSDVVPSVLSGPKPASTFLRMLRVVPPLRRLLRDLEPAAVCALQEQAGIATLLARGRRPWPAVAVGVQNHLGRKLAQRRRRPTSLAMACLMAGTYPKAQTLIAASQGVADDLRQRFPRSGERIEVIYNAGFDPPDASSELTPVAALPRPESGPLLVACGRLIEQKGFDLLLHALAKLDSDPAPHLWVMGEGPWRTRLEALTQQLHIESRVRWLGFHPEPSHVMGQADAFVLSSRWEGFGNVLVEAMACGVPVVAFDCPHGPREILDDGRAGRLVPAEDVDGLARNVAHLLAHPEEARRLAQRGRQRAQQFSPRVAATAYQELLVDLAAAHRRTRP